MRRWSAMLVALLLIAVALVGLQWRRVHQRSLAQWREILDELRLIDDAIAFHELELVDAHETRLHAAAEQLAGERWLLPLRATRLRDATETLARAAADTHTAADIGDQRGAELELRHTLRILRPLRALLPADMRAAMSQARLMPYVCPMHEAVESVHPGLCPRCGMALEPRHRANGPAYVAMRAVADHALVVGQRAHVTIDLATASGEPLRPEQLLEVHTRKIHLLIVDESLVDYHHEHPSDTATPGRYTVDFTPAKPGSYRIWADIVPAVTQLRELPQADLPGAGMGSPLADNATKLRDDVDGFHFELLPAQRFVIGQATPMRLVIARDGRPWARLEPLMGAYAHLVAFAADRQSVAHLHPVAPNPRDPTELGAAPLELVLTPKVAGIVVLFAQVQIDGRSRFARFVLDVDSRHVALGGQRAD